MSLNYRYNKKGEVIGMGWGRGENWEAGQARMQSEGENSKSKKNKKNKRNLKIKGTPGSSRGAMAAKAMAKARKKAGKSTLGDYGSGEDRGMKAAQAEAKRRIAEKKKKKQYEAQSGNTSKYASYGNFRGI